MVFRFLWRTLVGSRKQYYSFIQIFTTYYVRYEECNTTTCVSRTVTINELATVAPTGVRNKFNLQWFFYYILLSGGTATRRNNHMVFRFMWRYTGRY
jgi:hypothetical protein